MHLSSFLALFLCRINNRKKRRNFIKFIEESSRRWFSSIDLSRGKTKEEMKDDPIIIDELSVIKDTIPKKTTAKARLSIEIEADGSLTPPLEVKQI
jgi:hypothetical protein